MGKQLRLIPRALIVIALSFSLVMASALMAEAAVITITMDEVAQQPADGLVVEGVRFNGDALFNFGNVTTAFLNCPCTVGSANQVFVLGITQPTTKIRFGIAREPGAGFGSVTITLQAANGETQVFNVPLTNRGFGLLENRFSYNNRFHPIQHVFIEFPVQGGEFGIDNLQYEV